MESNRFKGAAILLLLIASVTFCKAQTWNEIFKQKQTQKKYLAEQIVALKLYADYLKKGYTIVNTGLQTVKNISNGEFKLHDAFINSLKLVNPLIRNNARVAEIVLFQLQISKAFHTLTQSGLLSDSDRDYLQSVQNATLSECGRDLDELLLIVMSGKIQMTDDERLRRLNGVYAAMKDKMAFVQSFVGDVNILFEQKKQEVKSINQLKDSYGINN